MRYCGGALNTSPGKIKIKNKKIAPALRSVVSVRLAVHKRRLKTLVVLNALDTAATLVWVWCGLAEEANPLMADLLRRSPSAFILGKLSLVQMGVALLWRLESVPSAHRASLLLCLVYASLVGWHAIHVFVFALQSF